MRLPGGAGDSAPRPRLFTGTLGSEDFKFTPLETQGAARDVLNGLRQRAQDSGFAPRNVPISRADQAAARLANPPLFSTVPGVNPESKLSNNPATKRLSAAAKKKKKSTALTSADLGNDSRNNTLG